MTDPHDPPPFSWATRWSQLARAAGLGGREPVLVALSGGADSVFLLHAVARAEPRPKVLAVHVDHGLRGSESEDDCGFCARLCARLAVPFARRSVTLDPEGSNLEARAREERYRALFEEARSAGFGTILTGHHEDDALETLLQRWLRGSPLPGLAGLKVRNVLAGRTRGREPEVAVVRPLLAMRREEVRRILRDHGLEWREDSSNRSPRFTRNRVRNQLLPHIEAACGREGVDGLRAFASAVESFEEELAARTAHLAWRPPAHAPASRSATAEVGGELERDALAGLAPPLLRRALWRLIREGTGLAPSRALQRLIEEDLARDRTTRRALPGGWSLQLKRRSLHLIPPGGEPPDPTSGRRHASDSERPAVSSAASAPPPSPAGSVARAAPSHRGGRSEPARHEGLRLSVPGSVRLGDGRTLVAEIVEVDEKAEPPRGRVQTELDARDLPPALTVRWVRPGDRFHGLGAPGSRPVRRFLADAGVPREERGRVPLVLAGDQIVWIAGVRPCEARRVRPGSTRRLRLSLEGAAELPLPSTGS